MRGFLILVTVSLIGFISLGIVASCASTSAPSPAQPASSGPAKPASPGTDATPAGTALDKLIAAAKAEGKVVFGGSDPAESATFEAWKSGFDKKFGFNSGAIHQSIRTTDLSVQIAAGAAAGRSIETDVVSVAGGSHTTLTERGLLMQYQDWQELFPHIKKEHVLYDGKGVLSFTRVYAIGFNTNLISREQVPDSFDGFLEPKWIGGKFIADSRGKPFERGVLHGWSQEQTLAFAAKLIAQKPIFVKGTTQIVQALAAGQAPMGILALDDILRLKAKGAPLDYKLTNPTFAGSITWSVLKGGPSPNLARLWVGWLASPEARKIVEEKEFVAVALPGSGSLQSQIVEKAGVKVVNETTEKEHGLITPMDKALAKFFAEAGIE